VSSRLVAPRNDPYGEIYDLRNDPDEMENLFEDSAIGACGQS